MAEVNVDGIMVPVEPVTFQSADRQLASQLARSKQGKRAAAVFTADIVSSFIGRGGGSAQTQANAYEVLDQLTPQLEEVVGQMSEQQIVLPAGYEQEQEPAPEPAAQVEPEPVADYEMPSDYAALLEEPAIDEDFDYAPAAAVEEETDDEYADPEVQRLKSELAKERKRSEHERKLRVQTARKDWKAEAKRVFNSGGIELISDEELEEIGADSHRGYAVAAKTIADRNKSVAARFAPRAADGESERDKIRAEERTRLEDMWGKPASTGGAAPAESVVQTQRLERARRTGNLAEILKARMFPE